MLESEDRIDGALTCLVAGQHIAMIGPPGTAKTFLYLRILKRLTGARSFTELMRKTMPPEAVYGTPSIVAMKNDDPARFITTGMLPEADLALLDEFPRTSDAINNGLLMILNEGLFKNGADVIEVPLSTAFLCANSLPIGESEHDLEAFWDRVGLRFIVDMPKDRQTWLRIAMMEIDPNPAAILDWSEIVAAKAEAKALPCSAELAEAVVEIQQRLLHEEQIVITPRRVGQAKDICRAWAWLQGATEVLPVHAEMLTHMFWEHPDQRVAVERIVSEVASPQLRTAVTIADTVQAFDARLREVLAMDVVGRAGDVSELFDKFAAQREELDEWLPQMEGRALRTAEAASRHLDQLQMILVEQGVGVKLKSIKGLRP